MSDGRQQWLSHDHNDRRDTRVDAQPAQQGERHRRTPHPAVANNATSTHTRGRREAAAEARRLTPVGLHRRDDGDATGPRAVSVHAREQHRLVAEHHLPRHTVGTRFVERVQYRLPQEGLEGRRDGDAASKHRAVADAAQPPRLWRHTQHTRADTVTHPRSHTNAETHARYSCGSIGGDRHEDNTRGIEERGHAQFDSDHCTSI
jgi:hypothetical protein